MSCVVYIATSLDGYIADADRGMDWLEALPNPDGADFGFADHMASIDAVVMGRGTFDTVKDFQPWPYEVPVIVVSSTLESVPDELSDNVRIIRGSPAEVVAECQEAGLERLYIDGGKLVTAFLDEGLIDKLTVSTVPVLLGAGVPLFGSLANHIWWEHQSTTAYAGGLVQSTYLPMPTSSG